VVKDKILKEKKKKKTMSLTNALYYTITNSLEETRAPPPHKRSD